MIQFNLLPDVKLAFLKAERTKRLVISISVLTSAVALGVFILLFFTVNVVQKKSLTDLNKDITTNATAIKATPDLNKILTIQSQLSSLTGLHDQKPATSRLFGYIGQVTPSNITISTIDTDFTQSTISISGGGPSLDAVNTFLDTLKFTTYTSDKVTTDTNAFTNVVLSSFGRSDKGATYTVTMSYDPAIFKITDKVTLKVPTQITTRSITEQPQVFKATGTTK